MRIIRTITGHCPILSEALEKVAVNQLSSHINISNTYYQYQSAYRKFQSTQTALLKILNDILESMDTSKVIPLIIFDLSDTWDTIDYTIYLEDLIICSRLLRKHSTGLNHIGLEDAWGLSQVTVCPAKRVSNLENIRVTFKSCAFHPLPHLAGVARFLNMLSLTISMLMIARCIFPFPRGTPLWH